MTYLTHQSTLQPEGLPESSRWSESAETTGNSKLVGSRPGGVPANSVTLSGSNTICLLIRGYRCAQPPATLSQPYGLPRSDYDSSGND